MGDARICIVLLYILAGLNLNAVRIAAFPAALDAALRIASVDQAVFTVFMRNIFVCAVDDHLEIGQEILDLIVRGRSRRRCAEHRIPVVDLSQVFIQRPDILEIPACVCRLSFHPIAHIVARTGSAVVSFAGIIVYACIGAARHGVVIACNVIRRPIEPTAAGIP